jgi:tetratricopeptide (TPR) repeat protein
LENLWRFEEAKFHYEQAIKFCPIDADAYLNLGVLFETHYKDYEIAREMYEKVLSINSLEIYAYNNLALLEQFEFKNFEKAIELWEIVFEIDNEYTQSLYGLAALIPEKEKYYLQEIISIKNESRAHFLLGQIFEKKDKNFNLAMYYYQSALNLMVHPQGKVVRAMANCCLKFGDFQEAKVYFETILEDFIEEVDVEFYQNFAKVLNSLENFAMAEVRFEQAIIELEGDNLSSQQLTSLPMLCPEEELMNEMSDQRRFCFLHFCRII